MDNILVKPITRYWILTSNYCWSDQSSGESWTSLHFIFWRDWVTESNLWADVSVRLKVWEWKDVRWRPLLGISWASPGPLLRPSWALTGSLAPPARHQSDIEGSQSESCQQDIVVRLSIHQSLILTCQNYFPHNYYSDDFILPILISTLFKRHFLFTKSREVRHFLKKMKKNKHFLNFLINMN